LDFSVGAAKKVQVIYYSQSGQLKSVVDSFCRDLVASENVEVVFVAVKPCKDFDFPWKFYDFFDAMPEAVLDRGVAIEPLEVDADADLTILAYTTWFLSPSSPIAAFLNSESAKVLQNKPVITLIACRDMWVMAQERVKEKLANIGAKHIDNVALIDRGKSLYSFVTTPRWLLTGRKDPFLFFPAAGISEEDIKSASRFGRRLLEALMQSDEKRGISLLQGLGAAHTANKLIASERLAIRSFGVWSRLMAWAGAPKSAGRRIVVTIYVAFLLLMIATLVPLNLLKNSLVSRFSRARIEDERRYYEAPSES
jgi:hypothetical protein